MAFMLGRAGRPLLTRANSAVRVAMLMYATMLALAVSGIAAVAAAEVNVTIKPDGSFDPQWVWVHNGDTVVWRLSDESDTIIPVRTVFPAGVEPGLDVCTDYRPYYPNGPNEFTGPMPRAASGIFSLGPDGPGLEEVAGARACEACRDNETLQALVGTGRSTRCLCESARPAAYAATMSSTWQDPDITGVFIRMLWKDVHTGPGQFEWHDLDREIDRAVKNGKLYSLAFKAGRKGTPDWIFAEVEALDFRDGGSKLEAGQCGFELRIGSPADDNYRKHYFELLREVARHIKKKNAWYRALAYIKPSGMNLITDENRLPSRCDPACPRWCSTETWAKEGDYRPSELRGFYREQFIQLAEDFPDKDLSYMLIQAGFPLVNEVGEYLGQPDPIEQLEGKETQERPCDFPGRGLLPSGTQQTECVLKDGVTLRGKRLVVQHNGLGPLCGDLNQDGEDDCEPNYMAAAKGRQGQIIGFQTNNATGVADPQQLEAAFQNGYCNSKATFFEIYEQRLWEARQLSSTGVLDPNAGGSLGDCRFTPNANRTIRDWGEMLHERRAARGAELSLDRPFPAMTHRFTFSRTTGGNDSQLYYYMHGSKCADGAKPRYGVIAVWPTVWTDLSQGAHPSVTPVSGFDVLGPPHKETLATVRSSGRIADDRRLGLNGISLREDGDRPCELALSFQDLPGQPESNPALGLTTTSSGLEKCNAPASTTRTAAFAEPQLFVRGISVCTPTTASIPVVKGVRIHAAKVNDNGTVIGGAQPVRSLTLGGCTAWQPARFCPPDQIAVGVRAFYVEAGGFTGLALQCQKLEAH